MFYTGPHLVLLYLWYCAFSTFADLWNPHSGCFYSSLPKFQSFRSSNFDCHDCNVLLALVILEKFYLFFTVLVLSVPLVLKNWTSKVARFFGATPMTLVSLSKVLSETKKVSEGSSSKITASSYLKQVLESGFGRLWAIAHRQANHVCTSNNLYGLLPTLRWGRMLLDDERLDSRTGCSKPASNNTITSKLHFPSWISWWSFLSATTTR